MFICPNCQSKLRKVDGEAGRFWSCPVCDGRAVTLPVLRKVIPQNIIRRLWQDVRSEKTKDGKSCPSCGLKMRLVPVADHESLLYLDVCLRCYFVWFDPKEFESLPGADDSLLRQRKFNQASRVALARAEVGLLQEQHKAKSEFDNAPDNWWEVLPAVFGLPVEYDDRGVSGRPIVTWSLAALMVLVFLGTFSHLDSIAENWGLIPADLYRHFGATLVTSFFLHGGLLHLLGNVYFLLVFGDNVEEDMGRRKYLLLIAASALLGDAFHILADPGSAAVVVGASGGISGIIVYYALQFPKTRIGILLLFHWYRVPVRIMIVLWLLIQVVGVYEQAVGLSNVSALAHLGGAGVGVLFCLHAKSSSESKKPAASGLEI